MNRLVLALSCLALLAGPAAADGWRDALAGADKALAAQKVDDSIALYRKALAGGAKGRARGRALLGLAKALYFKGDLPGAMETVEAGRAFIAKTFGADDLAMAANRQLYGILLLRLRHDPTGARDAFAQAARIRNAKVDAWDDGAGPMGPVLHKPSGISVPQRAGDLTQFRRDINNDDGTDVSIGYRAVGQAGGISVTVYIYRPRGTFDAIFGEESQAIRTYNPRAILRKQQPYPLETKAGKIEGRMAYFEYLGDRGPVGTRLYLFPGKRDYVKLRVTFRLADTDYVDDQVKALLGAIAWPAS